MKSGRTLLISALFLLTLLAAFLWLYPHMPARIPTHWNAQGQINGYMSPLGAVATPAIMMALLAVFTFLLPAISPRGYEMKPFVSVFVFIMLVIQAFLLVVALAVLLNGAGHPVQMSLICMLGVGVLLMVIGNYMGKVRKNFFFGIRTPWTLASDDVWERTHRLGGRLFVSAGLVVVIAALMHASPAWVFLPPLVAALIPCVYSLFAYRRLERLD